MTHISEKTKNIIGIVLLIVFVGMMFTGYIGEEAGVVFMKARNICLECIGIG